MDDNREFLEKFYRKQAAKSLKTVELILKSSAAEWSRKRKKLGTTDIEGTGDRKLNLQKKSFSGKDLHQFRFWNCELPNAKFRRSNLNNSTFSECSLTWADLTEANCANVRFNRVHMQEVNLSGASLVGAEFWEVYLDGAILEGADFSHAIFREVKFDQSVEMLATVKGLETVRGLPRGLYADVAAYRREQAEKKS